MNKYESGEIMSYMCVDIKCKNTDIINVEGYCSECGKQLHEVTKNEAERITEKKNSYNQSPNYYKHETRYQAPGSMKESKTQKLDKSLKNVLYALFALLCLGLIIVFGLYGVLMVGIILIGLLLVKGLNNLGGALGTKINNWLYK